jgi:hypothetical protein
MNSYKSILFYPIHLFLLWTQSAIPDNERAIPIQVSVEVLVLLFRILSGADDLPLLITFLSTHQSPNTVNRNANELVIGTVKLSSNLTTLAPYFHLLTPRPPLSALSSPFTP